MQNMNDMQTSTINTIISNVERAQAHVLLVNQLLLNNLNILAIY